MSNPLSYLSSPSFSSPGRPSSRNSGRSASPIVTLADEQLTIRTQMSTLKHTIRQQQAQLHTLENIVLAGPRPLPPGIMGSPPLSPADFDASASSSSPSPYAMRMQKRASFDHLHGLAGPDSQLPLPKRDTRRASFGEENGIREGIPTGSGRRTSSPTRSKIPVSSVGSARALAEEAAQDGNTSLNASASGSGLTPAASPNRRSSFAPGNTTKVLADLQAGVLNAKSALENTKTQLRVSQRQVSQLTRLTEDLKEGRERLRMENEGLNNVVARKERLLQETLERARKAEMELVSAKAQLKAETTNSKKSLKDMEAAVAEATARSAKAEREYVVLRDSMKGLTDSFQADVEALRQEMTRREDKVRAQEEEMGRKYSKLVEDMKRGREQGSTSEVKKLKEENERIRKEVEDCFREDIQQLRGEIEKSGKDSEQAWETAKSLADELARLRRLMQTTGSPSPLPPDAPDLPVPS